MKKSIQAAVLCLSLTLGLSAQAGDSSSCQTRPAAKKAKGKAAKNKMTQGRVQVGEEIAASFASPTKYAGSEQKAVWQDVITHRGASYIAPHFSRFVLAPGDYVIVRSPDNTRSWRYEGFGKGETGPVAEGFWGVHIPGETAIVELYSRGGQRQAAGYGYAIDKYARGFSAEEMDWQEPGFGTSGDGDFSTQALCGGDDSEWAKCYQSSESSAYNHGMPVARLLIDGTSACTGWLVGSEGHLMTNNHCISSSTSAMNTDYEFMAEGDSCSTSCASWGACPGTVVASSGTLVKTDRARDYTLIKLPVNPTGTYGYLQMRSTGAVLEERIYIPQHPKAHGKKIAVYSTDSNDQSGFAEVYSLSLSACQGGGPKDVGYFADTQGGSSGSPVLGYLDHLVVALHHCANCPNRGVPIQEVINHLGSALPTCAIRSSSCPDPLP